MTWNLARDGAMASRSRESAAGAQLTRRSCWPGLALGLRRARSQVEPEEPWSHEASAAREALLFRFSRELHCISLTKPRLVTGAGGRRGRQSTEECSELELELTKPLFFSFLLLLLLFLSFLSSPPFLVTAAFAAAPA